MSEIFTIKNRNNKKKYVSNVTDAWELTQEYFGIPSVQWQVGFENHDLETGRVYSKEMPIDILRAKYLCINGKKYKITSWQRANSEPPRVVFTIEKESIIDFNVEIVFYNDHLDILDWDDRMLIFKHPDWKTFKYKNIKFIDYVGREIKLSKWISALDSNSYYFPRTLNLDRYRKEVNILYSVF